MHIPKQMIYENSKKIVFFIHGFMGSPNQFCELMEKVYNEGFSVVSILLPGHGSTGFEFAKSTVGDWESYLRKEILRYRDYEKVYFVGHSIGGLLALNMSLEFNICGVVAISSPLKIYLLNLTANGKRLKILCSNKEKEPRKTYIKSFGINKPYLHTVILWIRVMFEPHKLMKKSKKILKNISVPVLTIHSKNDETVSFKSRDLFKEQLLSSAHEAIELIESYHAYYTESEKEIIDSAIVEFISK